MPGIRYNIGDVIEHRVGPNLRHVRVEMKERNIKNGQRGFQGEIVWDQETAPILISGKGWGYNSTITRVVTKTALPVKKTKKLRPKTCY